MPAYELRISDWSSDVCASDLTDVPLDARIMNEEPFGPLAPIAPFSDFDAVVEEANRLPYGLAAYAYTKSAKTAAAIGAALESGIDRKRCGLGTSGAGRVIYGGSRISKKTTKR